MLEMVRAAAGCVQCILVPSSMYSMHMDLRGIRHVVVLSKQLSYTKAAQELCMTQSALTRSIQAIERRCNARLFDRDRGGVHLTAIGRSFVERAAALLREAEDLERTLRLSTNADVGEVTFGMGPLAAQALLPAVLPKTLQDKPELRTHVMVRNIDTLLQALIREEIEFLVCPQDPIPTSAPVKSGFLGWFPMSLLVRAGHPVLQTPAGNEPPQFPLISPGQFKSIEGWPRHCRPYLSGPLHVIEDYGVAARLTEVTDAIWLCSTYAASPEIRAGRLQEIPPPPGQKALRFRMMLYSLDRRSLSPAALMLKSMFEERIRALATEDLTTTSAR
jgi:DNA-binding transcriptional LysR family regulator